MGSGCLGTAFTASPHAVPINAVQSASATLSNASLYLPNVMMRRIAAIMGLVAYRYDQFHKITVV